MAEFYPFRAVRPAKGKAADVACLPYDVLSKEQADALAVNPESFIHIIKSEVDLPADTDLYSEEVYQTAADNLNRMKQDGTLQKAETPEYYVYREIAPDHTQTGFVGTVSCREYETGIIKRHELTVAEKEDDRTHHILTCMAQTGLVFLTYTAGAQLADCLKEITAEEPEETFEQNGVIHQVWAVSDPAMVSRIREGFHDVNALYIADGHHRAASSCRAAKQLGADDTAEAGRFMAAAFQCDDLSLLGYHRYVKDLNGRSTDEFLDEVRKTFDLAEADDTALPDEEFHFIMCLPEKTYRMRPRANTYDTADSVGRLDVSVLQNSLLDPILGIRDPRRDKRISFVGGQSGAAEIRALAKQGGVGFILYPTGIHDLITVADDSRIMPPKSTWFEPKLLSGLFVHEL